MDEEIWTGAALGKPRGQEKQGLAFRLGVQGREKRSRLFF
jgi:hypothetical protein